MKKAGRTPEKAGSGITRAPSISSSLNNTQKPASRADMIHQELMDTVTSLSPKLAEVLTRESYEIQDLFEHDPSNGNHYPEAAIVDGEYEVAHTDDNDPNYDINQTDTEEFHEYFSLRELSDNQLGKDPDITINRSTLDHYLQGGSGTGF